MSPVKRRIPISVVMANYNHAQYIDEALGGIFEQTFQPAEVIIIDDCSTDNSVEVINSWAKRFPEQIRFLKNKENQGVLKTIQRGLEESSHDYLYFHSADDFILPNCFESYYEMLENHPQAPLCCSIPSYFTSNKDVYSAISPNWGNKPCYLPSSQLATLLKGKWIHGNTLIRKSRLIESGGIDHLLDYSADWFWLLVMGARHGICYCPETLTLNRILPTSFLETGRKDIKRTDKLFHRLLTLVNSPEFSDIYSFLHSSSALAAAGIEFAEYISNHPEWQTPKIQALIQLNNEELVIKQTFEAEFRNKLPPIINNLRENKINRIAIYGIGKHSDYLLNTWQKLGGPAFVLAIVSNHTEQEFYNKLRISKIDSIDPITLDAILISSQTWEKEMLNKAKAHFPQANIYSIWDLECSTN